MAGLHPVRSWRNHTIGCMDNRRCGAIVLGQIAGLGSVISLEASDELNRSAGEGIDVLVVITYSKKG
jgi:hypothetical protein